MLPLIPSRYYIRSVSCALESRGKQYGELYRVRSKQGCNANFHGGKVALQAAQVSSLGRSDRVRQQI